MVIVAETISLREARVDAMLRVLPEAVFEIDREGRFVDVHGGEIELVAPREQLVGARYAEALVAFPQLVEALDDLLGRAFGSDQISSVEYSLKLADGEHVYEARAVATSERAIVTVNDVTDMRRLLAHLVIADRQRAAAALAGSLHRFPTF
jgi:PAS domain-containing protein